MGIECRGTGLICPCFLFLSFSDSATSAPQSTRYNTTTPPQSPLSRRHPRKKENEMDHRPSQYLKPPSAHPHAHLPQRIPTASSSPRAPVTAHATATIAETVVFQGTHPITIGAETVIHPRARIYSFDGPAIIGEGCIISEKSTIGAAPLSSPVSSPAIGGPGPVGGREGVPTRISHSVTIAPLATVLPGAHIHSSVTIDSLATIDRRANIGAHSKVCATCHVPAKAVIRDWTVVWGSGAGFGQRRKRATKAAKNAGAVQGQGQGQVLEGKVIEDARLVVLKKEREALVKLIGASAAGSGRRR